MQPWRTQMARFNFRSDALLLFLFVVVVVHDATRKESEEASCRSSSSLQEINIDDAVPEPREDGDTMSMLQSVGAVHVKARASMPGNRPESTEASMKPEQFDSNFEGQVWAGLTMPSRLNSLQSYFVEQLRTASHGSLILAFFFASLCLVVLLRGFSQAEKKSLLVSGICLQGQDASRSGSQHMGDTLSLPFSPLQKSVSSPVDSPVGGLSEFLMESPERLMPICPALVMPACEARLLIPKHAIAEVVAGGDLVIFGLSGSPLLHASIREGDDHKLLHISMWQDVGAPCASVRMPDENALEPSTGCEILGPDHELFGTLRIQHGHPSVLAQRGVDMIKIDGDLDDLQLTIKTVIGAILATVQCNTGATGGVEHIFIKVGHGHDVVLMVACTLAVLFVSAGTRLAQ